MHFGDGIGTDWFSIAHLQGVRVPSIYEERLLLGAINAINPVGAQNDSKSLKCLCQRIEQFVHSALQMG